MIAGLHRFFIDIHGVTSVPCLVTSIIAGAINRRVPKAQRWRAGIIGVMLCESLDDGVDSDVGQTFRAGQVDCVRNRAADDPRCLQHRPDCSAGAERRGGKRGDCGAPGEAGAGDRQQDPAAVSRRQQRRVCTIICRDISTDAIAITNKTHILAYVGYGEQNCQNGDDGISPTTAQAMSSGKIIIKNNDEAHRTKDIHSMIVISLWEKGHVTGTLKIYYRRAHRITGSLKEMAIGLSQIISTQLEVSRAEQLCEMANKAELRALQSKINPHFLFNALNSINSSIRLNPDTARQLVINLSRYLRYNLELNDDETLRRGT
nr:Transcriptional regulatory protein YpdB [Candidatus Pantoea persica]